MGEGQSAVISADVCAISDCGGEDHEGGFGVVAKSRFCRGDTVRGGEFKEGHHIGEMEDRQAIIRRRGSASHFPSAFLVSDLGTYLAGTKSNPRKNHRCCLSWRARRMRLCEAGRGGSSFPSSAWVCSSRWGVSSSKSSEDEVEVEEACWWEMRTAIAGGSVCQCGDVECFLKSTIREVI